MIDTSGFSLEGTATNKASTSRGQGAGGCAPSVKVNCWCIDKQEEEVQQPTRFNTPIEESDLNPLHDTADDTSISFDNVE